MTFISLLSERLDSAMERLELSMPDHLRCSISASQDLRHGDYQSNVAMVLAKRLGIKPRELASQIIDVIDVEGIAQCEIAGPGFINFRLLPSAWATKVAEILQDARLGVERVEEVQTVVVDFSSPNVAKPMHVGHIRSTIIGDTIARVARFLGHKVISDNHIGDWGTQFGKVIYGWKHFLDREALEVKPVAELLRLYKKVHDLSKFDEKLASQCREELVLLQRGHEENLEIWRACVQHSREGLKEIYERLGIQFDYWLGESYYNEQLTELVDTLIEEGVAQQSDGAICVFSGGKLEDKKDPYRVYRDGEWQDLPMIIRKKDGGFNYATTDLATIDFRLKQWHADQMLYVVDARQAAHFKQLFDLAERRGVRAKMEHVAFGTINGKDGTPLKTREGDLPQLEDILEDSVAAAAQVLEEKSGHLPKEEKKKLAEMIGIGSVKFTELSHHRSSDYIFDLDKMVSLQGDTAPYLQYSYVRVQSIFSRLGREIDFSKLSLSVAADAEIQLCRMISRYGEVIPAMMEGYKPNTLASYLIELARAFHSFFEACPVLKAERIEQDTRLALCEATSRVLKHGLGLLGIATPDRM